MPSTIVNDPESIQNYRGKIANSIENLEMQIQKTERAIEAVSESWKDNNFVEFHRNFEEDMNMIKPLCNVLRDYEGNILFQLQQKLETYVGGPTHL